MRDIGIWLQVWGPVANVIDSYDGDGEIDVFLEGSEVEPAIVSRFNACWSKKVKILAIRDRVTVRGEISAIQSRCIFLKNCELV